MIVMGVDPGTLRTGYGIVKFRGGEYEPIDCGCIVPPPEHKLSERYLIIFNALEELMKIYQPDVLAVETQFVGKNVQSAIKLGQARGAAIIAAKRSGAAVHEYAPTKVKKAVVGKGYASKEQVVAMIQHLLKLGHVSIPHDAADALALAICHIQNMLYNTLCESEI